MGCSDKPPLAMALTLVCDSTVSRKKMSRSNSQHAKDTTLHPLAAHPLVFHTEQRASVGGERAAGKVLALLQLQLQADF